MKAILRSVGGSITLNQFELETGPENEVIEIFKLETISGNTRWLIALKEIPE